jgi:hypothetical protein
MRNLKVLCLLVFVFALVQGTVQAQVYGPQAGDKSVALKFGRSVSFDDVSYSEVNSGLESSSVADGVSISVPTDASYSSENDASNIIGVEAKYFVTSRIAIRLSASGSFGGSPSQDYVYGVDDPTGEYYPSTFQPSFNMIEGRSQMQYFLDLGADYYLPSKYERVCPYAGIQFNSIYSQLEIFDGYSGLDDNGDVIPTNDTRSGEAYSLGGSIIGGVDYYLTEGMFLGIEIRAVSYMYSVKRVFYQTGMEANDVDAHTTSFLAQPVLKLGFRF